MHLQWQTSKTFKIKYKHKYIKVLQGRSTTNLYEYVIKRAQERNEKIQNLIYSRMRIVCVYVSVYTWSAAFTIIFLRIFFSRTIPAA